MENPIEKKSSKTIIIIFIVLIIIILLIVGFIYLYTGGKLNFKKEKYELEELDFYIKCIDNDNYCTTNYILQYQNRTIEQGTIRKGLNKFTTYFNGTYTAYYWDDFHYLNQANLNVGKGQNILILEQKDEIKEINISFNNSIIKITSNGIIKKPIICFAWTIGIINVIPRYLTETDVPENYKGRIDRCYILKERFSNQTKKVPLNIKKMAYLTEKDYIEVHLIDKDQRLINNNLSWVYENNGDVGIKNLIHVIHYENL